MKRACKIFKLVWIVGFYQNYTNIQKPLESSLS